MLQGTNVVTQTLGFWRFRMNTYKALDVSLCAVIGTEIKMNDHREQIIHVVPQAHSADKHL